MNLQVTRTTLTEILPLRQLFLKEGQFQFIHDKCHRHGWADTYLITDNSNKIGYGSTWGMHEREIRDTIFEFYLLEPYRKKSFEIFSLLMECCLVPFIECQTNDFLLATMFFHFAHDIHPQATLFVDSAQTNIQIPGVQFERISPQQGYDSGKFALNLDDLHVATGGFLMNYNEPYADIYMDVQENHRGKGYGSLIVQEMKKEIYRMGKVPAARCNIKNQISRATLIKAGFRVCGFLLDGKL